MLCGAYKMDKKIELIINELLQNKFKFSQGKLIYDIEKIDDTARYVYKFCINGQSYFLKSFETSEEINALKIIEQLGFSDIIEIKYPLFVEKGYSGLTLNEFINNENAGVVLAELFNKLHGNKIILGDVKEEHFFYNPETNEIKITDFGASEISDSSYKRDDDIYQLLCIINKRLSYDDGFKIWRNFQERYMFKDVLKKFPGRRIGEELKAYLNH